MKSVGIIAEYNPFHNGHLYHINEIKKMYPNYLIILVLIGNFTQRGDCSVINKWDKTELALNYVDLVVELPFTFCTQSSDFYAYGAIKLLDYLNVDYLVFGSELNNINTLNHLADIQNTKEFNDIVKHYLDNGLNYPTSNSKALVDLTNININTPNDLLGISYIKAIKEINSKIIPISIKRSFDYHNNINSASNIRELLKNNKNIKKYVPIITTKYLNNIYFIEDYYNLLKYKILITENLKQFVDIDEGLDIRIKKSIIVSNTLEELINNVKSKRFTYNKIKRALLHILCDFKKIDNDKKIKYIKVLGFNNNGKKYLNSIKKSIDIPIITNYKKDYYELLKYDLLSTSIYDYNLIINEYKNKPIIKD